MTTPVEHTPAAEIATYRVDSDYDALVADALDEADGLYTEITERRAQLENADILRGARAL